MKLNLRGLEAFRETMQCGSVTAAAARMGMTQPAVSRLIAQLEQEAGFGLFYRDKGRLSPTPNRRSTPPTSFGTSSPPTPGRADPDRSASRNPAR